MKSRNREINIFNMSLLDILSGALGAFCFLTLVLFPYYKPNQQQQQPQGPPPGNYEEAMRRIQELQQQLQQCQANHADCQSQMQQATQKINELNMRNPITIVAAFAGPNDLDIYEEDDRTNAKGQKAPKPDGKVKQWPFWEADSRMDFPAGFASEIWSLRDTPAGDYRIYYKLFKLAPGNKPTEVVGTIMLSQDPNLVLPSVTLTEEGQVIHVATITTTSDGHAKIRVEVPGAQNGKQ